MCATYLLLFCLRINLMQNDISGGNCLLLSPVLPTLSWDAIVLLIAIHDYLLGFSPT